MLYSRKKVVCFGGGTGLPALLSGLKDNPWLDITAVVNMFDTGGSSGELKDRFGILPPGDILKCLLALSAREQYARELLQSRIRNSHFTGHTGGNVLLLGLENVFGDYLASVDAFGQILSIKGKVVPVTLEQSILCARFEDGSVHKGETSVDIGVHEGKRPLDLFLEPRVPASKQAIEAIAEADALCVGPGSLYTSVLPNFLPDGIVETIRGARGKIIYIANLLTEGKGMQGMMLEDIVDTVERHIGRSVDYVVANRHLPSEETLIERYATENKYPIVSRDDSEADERFVFAKLWLDKNIARHDSSRLGYLVSSVIAR
jgi:uncharacterized cofD-like protein